MIPAISTIPLRQMASGDRLSLQVYKFIGASPGKKVYIQSNLHGAEIAGNAVIHQLIEFLLTVNDTDLTGEIWLFLFVIQWEPTSVLTFFHLADTVFMKLKTGTASFGTMKKKLMIYLPLLNLKLILI